MRILVFSDSHGDVKVIDDILVREEYDLLLHAGDYTVAKELIASRFDHWVDGNNDYPRNKYDEDFRIGTFNFNLQHGDMLPLYHMSKVAKKMKKNGVDVLVFGHTHIPHNEVLHGVHLFNPGSCTFPRSDWGKTYGVININNDKITFEVKKI